MRPEPAIAVWTDHAYRMARSWHAAWNGHDADRVVALCDQDVQFRSPFVALLCGGGVVEGVAHYDRTDLEAVAATATATGASR